MKNSSSVNCKQGRKLGYKTYFYRLLVRLFPDEIQPTDDASTEKMFIDKDTDGYCIHFERNKLICNIWHNHPSACRAYDCNTDFLLQVAIRKPFKNIVDLAILDNTF